MTDSRKLQVVAKVAYYWSIKQVQMASACAHPGNTKLFSRESQRNSD